MAISTIVPRVFSKLSAPSRGRSYAAPLPERILANEVAATTQIILKGFFGAPVEGRPVDQKWDLTRQLYSRPMKAVNPSNCYWSRTTLPLCA